MSEKEKQTLERFAEATKNLNEVEKERILATAEGMEIMKEYASKDDKTEEKLKAVADVLKVKIDKLLE